MGTHEAHLLVRELNKCCLGRVMNSITKLTAEEDTNVAPKPIKTTDENAILSDIQEETKCKALQRLLFPIEHTDVTEGPWIEHALYRE